MDDLDNKEFNLALVSLYKKGYKQISAQTLADELWPDTRHINSNGQQFNLASGVAGKMLRKYRGATEIKNRVWEIVPEFLRSNNA